MPKRNNPSPLISYVWWAVNDIEERRAKLAGDLKKLHEGIRPSVNEDGQEDPSGGLCVVSRADLQQMEETSLAGLLHIQNVMVLLAQQAEEAAEEPVEEGSSVEEDALSFLGRAVRREKRATQAPRRSLRRRMKRAVIELLKEEE